MLARDDVSSTLMTRRLLGEPVRGVLVLAVLAALLAPLAQAAPASQAVVLVYHVHPDPRAGEPDADPFSTPNATSAGLFQGSLGVRLPLTRLDGVQPVEPQGDPSLALNHFREMQSLLLARQRAGSPLALTLAVTRDADGLAIQLDARATRAVEGPHELRVVVAEDGIPYDAPNGVRTHRFVARHDLDARPFDLQPGSASARLAAPVPDGADPARLAVVAYVRGPDGAVLQSAMARPGERVEQTTKAVLVEHASATWCEPCAPADEAIHLLSTQFGAGASLSGATGGTLRAPGLWSVAGLALGLGGGILLMRRRA